MDITKQDLYDIKRDTVNEIRVLIAEFVTREQVSEMLVKCSEHRSESNAKDFKLLNWRVKGIIATQEQINESLKEMNSSRKKHEQRITDIEKLHEKQEYLAEQMEKVEEKSDKNVRRQHYSWQIRAAQYASIAAMVSVFMYIIGFVKTFIENLLT